jgi:hypothetical protein
MKSGVSTIQNIPKYEPLNLDEMSRNKKIEIKS